MIHTFQIKVKKFLIFGNIPFNHSYVITYFQQSLKLVAACSVLAHSQTIILMDVRAIMVRFQEGKFLLSKASRKHSLSLAVIL